MAQTRKQNQKPNQKRYPDELLRRLRNDIRWQPFLQRLNWPHKRREGQLAFLCPRCQEFRTAVNPRTNLGRCFACQTNFNPIDFLLTIGTYDFVEAVDFLTTMLPRD